MTATRRPPTCEDTIGPYYPIPFLDADRMDLTRAHPGLAVGPRGRRIELRGRVLDRFGQPAAGALLEFHHANADGLAPGPGVARDPRFDPHFEGAARCRPADGRFALRTVMPGADAGRAPHVGLTIFSDGLARLATQIFFDGEADNAPGRPRADGEPIAIAGRVLDADGRAPISRGRTSAAGARRTFTCRCAAARRGW